jgi:hypothetical protein
VASAWITDAPAFCNARLIKDWISAGFICP